MSDLQAGGTPERARAAAELERLLIDTRRRKLRGLLIRGSVLALVLSLAFFGVVLLAAGLYAGATLSQARVAYAVAADDAGDGAADAAGADDDGARLIATMGAVQTAFAAESPPAWTPAGVHARLDLAATYRLARAALVKPDDAPPEPSTIYPTAHRLWAGLSAADDASDPD